MNRIVPMLQKSLVLALLAAELLVAPRASAQGHSFAPEQGSFLLDGAPWMIRSGEMHYARVPQQYWRDRFKKMRAMGLNTVSTYVFWNLHEPVPGTFDFTGPLDIAAFVRTAQEEGLKVILRPGPYICGEWEFGGLPSWLLKTPAVHVRTSDPRFLAAADRFLKKVGEQLADLTIDKGGPIILVQVENEYGSFGNDRVYLDAIRQSLTDAGFGSHLYTTDSVSGRPDVIAELSHGSFSDLPLAINFGQTPTPEAYFSEIAGLHLATPRMTGEYWTGWFDHFGSAHSVTSTTDGPSGVDWMMKNNISFNLYMFHGGTSFGFMNGANWDGQYEPDTTSYDYDAPLDEAGRTTAKFNAYRDVIAKNLPPTESVAPLPPSIPMVAVPAFTFTQSAPLSQLYASPTSAATAQSFEDLDQAYGLVLYRHQVTAPYHGTLTIPQVRDYAQISQGSHLFGTLDRRLNQTALAVDLVPGQPLDILVENMGRINYSGEIAGENKGLISPVTTTDGALQGWAMYKLPLNDLSGLSFQPINSESAGPSFYRATMVLGQVGDTYLDVRGWNKGLVFVNGHNLGRFWQIGPQRTLFCPGVWLKSGENEVIVFEEFPGAQRTMQGLTSPVYGN